MDKNDVLVRAYNRDLIKGYKLIISDNLNFRKDSFQYCTNLRKLVIGNISLDVQVVDGVLFVHKNINKLYTHKHIYHGIKFYGYEGYTLYKVFGQIRTSELYLLEHDGEYITNECILNGFYKLFKIVAPLECDKIYKTNSLMF